jgi:Ca-activated chloride channel homolog
MEFLAPGFLLLLLAVPLVFALKNARRNLRHSVLRSTALALCILALARPAQITSAATEHVIFIVDRSASISAPSAALAESYWERLASQLPATAKLQRLDCGLEGGTPLGETLRQAAAKIPIGEPGCVIIASDGGATQKDWFSSADLSSRGIPIHVAPLTSAATDPRIVGLTCHETLRAGHPARFSARLEGSAATVRIGLFASGAATPLVSSEEIILSGAQTVILDFEPSEAGFMLLEARLEILVGSNLYLENDVWQQTFAVQDPIPVLYLGQRLRGGMEEFAQLIGPGFQLESSADVSLVNPADYPLVLLDDRPAESIPLSFQNNLSDAVTSGGTGLWMSGGGGSFGPGGWSDTPVADLLPVEFVQKEEKRDPSTTLVVIIDTSGSMGGNRVQLAKEVARLAIHRLLPHDKAGIVEFYGAKHWAAPIQPASNIIELERALNRMNAGGGTVILPAIEEAFYAMQNVQTRYKHVLVLTDGGVETGDFESLMRNMADKGITVSTVLIGSQAHSEFLVNMANWGKGRFYNVPNRFNLPEVILKQPASAKLPAYRPGAHQLAGHGSPAWWAGTDPNTVPDLSGYVETRARAGAEVLLETVQGSHPIFASWRYGLGRVSALTTEPVGPGTDNWQDWTGLGPFLAQLLSRTAGDSADDFHFQVQRRGVEVVLSAKRRFANNANPRARLLDSELDIQPIFQQLAPDYFEARWLQAATTPLYLEAGSREHPQRHTRLVLDAFSDHAPELQVDARDFLPLAQLASATTGQVLRSDSGPPATSPGQALRLREYAPWLLLLGLLLFLCDIYYRRRQSFRGALA